MKVRSMLKILISHVRDFPLDVDSALPCLAVLSHITSLRLEVVILKYPWLIFELDQQQQHLKVWDLSLLFVMDRAQRLCFFRPLESCRWTRTCQWVVWWHCSSLGYPEARIPSPNVRPVPHIDGKWRLRIWTAFQAVSNECANSLVFTESHLDVTQNQSSKAHDGCVTGIVFEPRGHRLLSTGSDNRLRLWDVETGVNKMVHYPSTYTLDRVSCQLAVSSNGDLVFFPSRKRINAYDIESGELVYYLEGHAATVICCCYHPSLQELYTGGLLLVLNILSFALIPLGRDSQINLWSPASEEHQLNGERDSEDDWEDEWVVKSTYSWRIGVGRTSCYE